MVTMRILANQENGSVKTLAEKKHDIAALIGTKSEPFTFDMGKGFSIKIRFNIAPACPKQNVALYKKEVELGNKELFSVDDPSKIAGLLADDGKEESKTAAEIKE